MSLPPLGKVERRFLSAGDIEVLADSIDPRYRLMVLLGGYAGLRLGELAALRWSSFTVGYRAVRITETLTNVNGEVSIGPPKTRASIRTVSLPRFLVEEVEHFSVGSGDDLLFSAPRGGPPASQRFVKGSGCRPWRRRVWNGAPRTPSVIR